MVIMWEVFWLETNNNSSGNTLNNTDNCYRAVFFLLKFLLSWFLLHLSPKEFTAKVYVQQRTESEEETELEHRVLLSVWSETKLSRFIRCILGHKQTRKTLLRAQRLPGGGGRRKRRGGEGGNKEGDREEDLESREASRRDLTAAKELLVCWNPNSCYYWILDVCSHLRTPVTHLK